MPADRITREHDEDHDFDSMEAVAQDLLDALEKKDHRAIAQALRSAFEILDSEPHEEGPHTNE